MKKIFLYPSCLLVSFSFFMSSCNGGSPSEKEEEIKDTMSAAPATTSISQNEEETTYTLPSPVQIAAMFSKAGLKYYAGITNATDNSAKFLSSNTATKITVFGFFLSDLSYCVLNKQKEESKKYFKICKQFAENLGLVSVFQSNNIPQRLEKNIEHTDSVLKILSEIQMNSDNTVEENQQEYISVITFAGAWIESMYIGTQVHAKEKNTNVAASITEQMGIAENIVKALKALPSDKADASALIQDINSLDEIYNSFKAVKELKAMGPDAADAAVLRLSIEDLTRFSKKVEAIRERIIKG
ncbi:MAG: hypothetical protein JST67_10300 [Bacteroidetes bacterium]|nr:hypothetical protein [Bacteroidota bacterium]